MPGVEGGPTEAFSEQWYRSKEGERELSVLLPTVRSSFGRGARAAQAVARRSILSCPVWQRSRVIAAAQGQA